MAILNPEKSVYYLNALYFVICSLSKVGYGDIVPFDNSEKVYVILINIVGIVLFGYIIN